MTFVYNAHTIINLVHVLYFKNTQRKFFSVSLEIEFIEPIYELVMGFFLLFSTFFMCDVELIIWSFLPYFFLIHWNNSSLHCCCNWYMKWFVTYDLPTVWFKYYKFRHSSKKSIIFQYYNANTHDLFLILTPLLWCYFIEEIICAF